MAKEPKSSIGDEIEGRAFTLFTARVAALAPGAGHEAADLDREAKFAFRAATAFAVESIRRDSDKPKAA